MSFELPSLSLKLNNNFRNENKNENINDINNTVIINKDSKDSSTELKGVLPEIIEKLQILEYFRDFKIHCFKRREHYKIYIHFSY
jgi:hypothetical protein